jgi:deoxyribodipyrimidine photo-lyase
MFEANSAVAKQRLNSFISSAGKTYTSKRNYDFGPDDRSNVSALSPWVRLRVLPEWTVINEVLNQHTASGASKFIDEVCWRTYWKGWLHLRPTVWDAYRADLAESKKSADKNLGYCRAIQGRSGIECMDMWTRELIETGYLHNHARMWYASLWVHTLKLPWVLGADFFLKHLLDGDAASNTLSWRWVAGLHTEGKTYLASAANIEKFTAGRFSPKETFATEPTLLAPDKADHPVQVVERFADLPTSGRIGVLVHEEDLSALDWIRDEVGATAFAGLLPRETYEAHGISSGVTEFRQTCMQDVLSDHGPTCISIPEVIEWATSANLQHVVLAEPPVGLWNEVTPRLKAALAEHTIQLSLTRHWWDEHFYPSARSGFFRFKKAIPAALDLISQPRLKL